VKDIHKKEFVVKRDPISEKGERYETKSFLGGGGGTSRWRGRKRRRGRDANPGNHRKGSNGPKKPLI